MSLDEFYEQLGQIKEHHQKYPNEPIEAPEFEFMRTSHQHDNGEEEEEDDDMEEDDGKLKTGGGLTT
jgi:splicing factor 3A subunit 3